MDEQKCMWVENEQEGKYVTFSLNLRQWNQLKKKVEKAFRTPYDFNEVRFSMPYLDDNILEFEGHCCLERKRCK